MASLLVLSFRSLTGTYHGRRDGGEPEWPPSPLRAFQAMVATSARLGPTEAIRAALQWLERRPAPIITAPRAVPGAGYRLSVPNNSMDIVAGSWARRATKDDAASHRTMKTVRPSHLVGGDPVRFAWPLDPEAEPEAQRHLTALERVAIHVSALGWGIDIVTAEASILEETTWGSLREQLWLPAAGHHGVPLRVPQEGTLADLDDRFEKWSHRLDGGVLRVPPPLSRYATVAYAPESSWSGPQFAAFQFLTPDGARYRAFDTCREALSVAGMLRHATADAAARSGWPDPRIASVVLGHGVDREAETNRPTLRERFSFLPLPSLQRWSSAAPRRVGDVRRCVISIHSGGASELAAWARQALSGQMLVPSGASRSGLISPIPASESSVRLYTSAAAAWASVTPVILPGFDERRHGRKSGSSVAGEARTEALLRRALLQAGIPGELAGHANLEWFPSGFLPGVEHVSRYGVPDHLRRYPRVHVKLTWRDRFGDALELPGPFCIGGGRFYGLGLLAPLPRSAGS